jgi:DNA-binding response OmpR family regulator
MKLRVLIFEDNDSLRSSLKHIFDELGYEVFTFPDPAMCPVFDSVHHNCPLDHACADIIISDVNMPTKTGLELIKDRQERGCKIKFRALMSGEWSDSDLQYAQELGCRVFHKPFNFGEMLQWLDYCGKRIEPDRVLSDWFTN